MSLLHQKSLESGLVPSIGQHCSELEKIFEPRLHVARGPDQAGACARAHRESAAIWDSCERIPNSLISRYIWPSSEAGKKAMHATASVFINDDESGLHADFERWLEKLAPEKPYAAYDHNRTGEDNADAHIKRTIMGWEVGPGSRMPASKTGDGRVTCSASSLRELSAVSSVPRHRIAHLGASGSARLTRVICI
jgi:hypothetical protein